MPYGSKDISRAAVKIALSEDRQEEKKIKEMYQKKDINCCD